MTAGHPVVLIPYPWDFAIGPRAGAALNERSHLASLRIETFEATGVIRAGPPPRDT